MPLERARGVRGFKKGERSFFASQARNCKQTVIQASSPLTKKQNFKFLKNYSANFKISLTPKNWLLKFSFAYSLAQILEPKLLVHEILKFNCMQCASTKACPSNVVRASGIIKGEGSSFASQARNCKQTVIQASSLLTKKKL